MKDPAFNFYSDNFLSGTMFMTDEQVGKYIRLLCAQHQSGHLCEDDMIFICKSYDEKIWSKFVKDGDGRFFNERLEIEINKRKSYSESRSNNKKGKKLNKEIISKSYDKHMGIGNGIGIENELLKFDFKSSLLELNIESNIVSDWLKVRSKKKASNTETAFKRIKSEIEKSGYPANECIKLAVEKNWIGFEAEWMLNIKGKTQPVVVTTQRKVHYKLNGAFVTHYEHAYLSNLKQYPDIVEFLNYVD